MGKATTATLRIERIAVKHLESFWHGDRGASPDEGLVPINPLRARAHANNPNASPDDVALVVAYLGKTCVGYLGLMPGVLRIGEKFHKVFFGTTLYVPPEYRRYGIAISLMGELKRLGEDIVIAGLSDDAAAVYRHLRWKELAALPLYELEIRKGEVASIPLRMIRRLLRRAGVPSEWLNSCVASLDAMYYQAQKRLLYSRLARRPGGGLEKAKWNEVRHVLPDEFNALEECGSEPHFYRSGQVINWMLDYRWPERKADMDQRSTGYYFSSSCVDFGHVAVRITSQQGDECLGYVVLSFRKEEHCTTLKLLDVRLSEPFLRPVVVAIAIQYAKVYQVDRLEFAAEWLEAISVRFSKSASPIRRERSYFYFDAAGAGLLTQVIDRLALSYCDGDRAFT
jgi:hypothetical protein